MSPITSKFWNLVQWNTYKKDFEPGLFHSVTSLFSNLDLPRREILTELLSKYLSHQLDVSTRCGYLQKLTTSAG